MTSAYLQGLVRRKPLAPRVGALGEGPWRSSKTPGVNLAISNDYLAKKGLLSLRNG